MSKIIPLTSLKIHSKGQIQKFNFDNNENAPLKKHLQDMGFVQGRSLELMHKGFNIFVTRVGSDTPITVDAPTAKIIMLRALEEDVIDLSSKNRNNIFAKLFNLITQKGGKSAK